MTIIRATADSLATIAIILAIATTPRISVAGEVWEESTYSRETYPIVYVDVEDADVIVYFTQFENEARGSDVIWYKPTSKSSHTAYTKFHVTEVKNHNPLTRRQPSTSLEMWDGKTVLYVCKTTDKAMARWVNLNHPYARAHLFSKSRE